MLNVRDNFYLPYLIVSGGKMSRGSCVHRLGSKHPICMSGKLVQAEGPACTDTGARTPIGMSGIFNVTVVNICVLNIDTVATFCV